MEQQEDELAHLRRAMTQQPWRNRNAPLTSLICSPTKGYQKPFATLHEQRNGGILFKPSQLKKMLFEQLLYHSDDLYLTLLSNQHLLQTGETTLR